MIIVDDNFLAPGVCRSIVDSYNAKIAAGTISPNGVGSGREDIHLHLVTDGVPDIVERAKTLLQFHFFHALNNRLVLDYCAYTRLAVGRGHELHADAVKLDGSPNHTPDRVVSAVVYLSHGEHDFGNGKLIFPELGVTISARPGLLIGFPTDVKHQHSVTIVSRGSRDAILIWFKYPPVC